jgi:CRP/FNR family transcriptional regulator, cyclic AMP receptor protein
MGKSMVKQFQGSAGRPRLIDALMSQPLIGDRDLATAIARRVKLQEAPAGANLIVQGAHKADLFLILQGEFSISIGGRIVARKKAGEHVGEMAVVDPHASRSASVAALSDSVVARISESDFSALADKFPQLWRRIALELAGLVRDGNTTRQREKPGRGRFRPGVSAFIAS